MDIPVDKLIAHELVYASLFAEVKETPHAVFVECPEIPDLWEGNRALRLRDDGRGPDAVAAAVVAQIRARTLRPVVDLDPIAEAQGIGDSIRALGLQPLPDDWLLMRYAPPEAPELPNRGVSVETICGGIDSPGVREWVAAAVADESAEEDRRMWAAVALREAAAAACECFLGRIEGQAAGICMLLGACGWGRVEEVATRPEWRRRGVASALAAHAVRRSIEMGNEVTYLFTEPGGAGEQVYRRLGFEPWGRSVLCRHRA